jgi:voltage-gated potassium channel
VFTNLVDLKDPQVKRLVSHAVKLTVLIGIGTIGFMVIEKWAFIDALFMSVTTIATVGYGEVHPLSSGGRLFAIFMILFGVGEFLQIVNDMLTLSVELKAGRRMKNEILKLNNHQIICGYGRTGQEVAKQLRLSKIPVIVIEQKPNVVKVAEDDGFLVIEGDASTDEALLSAQILKARGLTCAMPDDSINSFVALSARSLNENIDVVSRAANPGTELKLKRVGARIVISPYVICGQRLAAAITHPLVTEFLEVVMHTPDQDLRLEQIVLFSNCPLLGLTLRDADIKAKSGAMVLAVKKGEKMITNPLPELKFELGDVLVALGAQQELEALGRLSGACAS